MIERVIWYEGEGVHLSLTLHINEPASHSTQTTTYQCLIVP